MKYSADELYEEKEKQEEIKHETVEAKGERNVSVNWLLLAYFIAGAGALSLEVVWTRTLTPVLGSTVYAFSVMLAAFLLGVALGSMVMAKLIKRIKRPVIFLVLIESLIGLLVLITIPVFPGLSLVFLRFFKWSGGRFYLLQMFKFGVSFLVMLGPCFLMGMAFPLVNGLAARQLKSLGKTVGEIYLVNTMGSVLGAVGAGFWLIPRLGMQKSLVMSAAMYCLVALIVVMKMLKSRLLVKGLVFIVCVTLVMIGWWMPRWNVRVLNSGAYVYANHYLENDPDLDQLDEVVFYKEGELATVMVTKAKAGHLSLKIDGKTDAGTGEDMNTQLILGHLPMLVHQKPEDVLVIGLGSGVSLGAVEQHDWLKTVEAVEIESAVVEAAEYFTEANDNALKDPRLKLIMADGRNYSLMTDKRYDVITAEPSNPWMTGNANLFTKEQFEIYKGRLKPGGVMLQWAHTYDLTGDSFKTILATFQQVFPHTTVWQNFEGTDIFLMGTEESLVVDLDLWRERIEEEKVRVDLAQVYLDDPLMFLSRMVLDEEGVKKAAKGAELHTDNRPRLELQSPKGIILDLGLTRTGNLEVLEQERVSIFKIIEEVKDEQLKQKLRDYVLSRSHIIQGEIYFSKKDPVKGMVEYEKALSLVADNPPAKKRLAEAYFAQGQHFLTKKQDWEAEESFLRAVELEPERLEHYRALAKVYVRQGKFDRAIEVYQRALRIDSSDVYVQAQLGALFIKKGLLDEAEAAFRRIVELDGQNYSAYNNLGVIYQLKGDRKRVVEVLEQSLAIELNQPEIKKWLREIDF